MYNEIFTLIQETIFGGASLAPASYEYLFTAGVSGALCLLTLAFPFIVVFGVIKMVLPSGRW